MNETRTDKGATVHTHTLTLMRDDNRTGDKFGQHFYVERSGTAVVKVEYLEYRPYDSAIAGRWGRSVAALYGATFIDRRPADCLYGWGSD